MKRTFLSMIVGFSMTVALSLSAPMARADVQLQAGGATFPDPIYEQWIKDFTAANSGVKLSYAAKGSGAGISGLLDKTLDFAGSDAPMATGDLKSSTSKLPDFVQIPSVAGAVVMAYNIPGFSGDLKLSGEVIAGIYLGKIGNWNDAAIKALNPGASLPNLAISAIHRSDGSGTNFVFSSYLCTQSDDFQTKVGFGKAVNWPGGQGAAQNAGVTQAVKSTQGALGYVELNYAIANNIPYALVKNESGKFVKASTTSVSSAGEGALKDMDRTKSLTVRLWAREGDGVYPISSYTYLICYKDLGYLKDESKAKAIVDFFWYAAHDGQKEAAGLTYASPSDGVRARIEKAIGSITYDGKVIHPVD